MKATSGLPAHSDADYAGGGQPFWLSRRQKARPDPEGAAMRRRATSPLSNQLAAAGSVHTHRTHPPTSTTDDFIVTHNTYTIIAVMEKRCPASPASC